MGLDTTHDCWHGPYSSFGAWRLKLSQLAGHKKRVDVVDILGKPHEIPTTDLDYDRFDPKNFDGDWDKIPADPLLILIVHSDCEGHINPEHALPLAERLEELLPMLDPVEDVYYIAKTEQFIDGLRDAAAKNEVVGFH